MLNEPLKYNNDTKLLFLDFETENLNLSFQPPVPNRPWQSSMIKVQGSKVIEEIDKLTKWPNFKIGDGAAMVTKFYSRYNERWGSTMSEALQTHGQKPEKTFEIIKEQVDWCDHIVGHNVLGFDVFLLMEWYKMYGEDWEELPYKLIDTACLAKGIKLEDKYKKGEDLLAYQYKMYHTVKRGVKTSLQFLAKEYKLDFDPELLHDGLYDLFQNIKIWDKLKWQLDI
tara:strand:- start:6479 stop:7156 length:678 start_codon:yes stop_codon:yes gene_type:complete